jgi:hypothetical protein
VTTHEAGPPDQAAPPENTNHQPPPIVPDGADTFAAGSNGARLLDAVHAALVRYVVFPSPQAADAVTLWIAATHAQDAFEHAPRLAAVSPEKRCGKSRLMDVAEALCHKSFVTINISSAALARTVTRENPPTLFVDEADTIFGPKASDSHEDLRGIVNSGHQRGRQYTRYDAAHREIEHWPTFALAMLASIGDLPDTIMDRAVVIRMRRRAQGETVAPYRTRRDRPALRTLHDQLCDWAELHLEMLTDVEPVMPVEDRAADTWEPLVAMADLAGGEWPQRARRACVALVAAENATDVETSIGARLLSDIRDVFANWTVSFISSADLVNALRKTDDGPWHDLDLSVQGLSKRLRPYDIRPVRNTAGAMRGYRLRDFADAFARYLTVTGATNLTPSDGSELSVVSELSRQSDGLTTSDGGLAYGDDADRPTLFGGHSE